MKKLIIHTETKVTVHVTLLGGRTCCSEQRLTGMVRRVGSVRTMVTLQFHVMLMIDLSAEL